MVLDPITVGLGITAAATGLASFGMGIGQAAKQRRAQAKAERDSKRMMQEAKSLATRNFYEELQVPIGAYEKQFRENTAQQMQGIQALQEAGGRSLIGGIGKIHSQATAANQDTTNAMAEALYSNDLQKAKAAQQMNDMLIDIEVGGAADESRRALDASRMANQAFTSGLGGLQGALQAAGDFVPLYGKQSVGQQTIGGLSKKHKGQFLNKGGTPMSRKEIINQINLMSPEQQAALKHNPDNFDYTKVQVGKGQPIDWSNPISGINTGVGNNPFQGMGNIDPINITQNTLLDPNFNPLTLFQPPPISLLPPGGGTTFN